MGSAGRTAVIWGGSFMFIGVAVKELPALLIVLGTRGHCRRDSAAHSPFHWIGSLPNRPPRPGFACGGMAILNNAIPFTLISWGQHHIAQRAWRRSSMQQRLCLQRFSWRWRALSQSPFARPLHWIIGFVGVVVLQGGGLQQSRDAKPWHSRGDGRLNLLWLVCTLVEKDADGHSAANNQPHCQLLLSTGIMAVIVLLFSDLSLYANASMQDVGCTCRTGGTFNVNRLPSVLPDHRTRGAILRLAGNDAGSRICHRTGLSGSR